MICACAPLLRVFFRAYLSEPIRTHKASLTRIATSQSRQSDKLEAGTWSSSSNHDDSVQASPSFVDEKNLTRHSTRPSLVTDPYEREVIQTPADFEAFALQNLKKHKPQFDRSARRSHAEPEEDAHPILSPSNAALNSPRKYSV